MELANETEATLSLLESTAQSNFSMFTNQVDREQFERLKSRLRVVESENTELKRLQPRLIDAKGNDCTAEFIKLDKELQNARKSSDGWEEDYRQLSKKFTELEQSALTQIDQREKEITKIKNQALELEEENNILREQIQDEKSKFHRLQSEHLEQPLREVELREQIQNSILKIHTSANQQLNATVLNDSLGDLNIDDAEQIATHMYMILDKLDKNSQETEELQTAIFAFLAEHGFNADPQKFEIYSHIYKEAISKRQREIRKFGNKLVRTNRGSVSVGDREYEAYMRHLYQDSISLSTTYPSFGGMAVTQLSEIEMSVPEADPTDVHNVTIESVAAIQLVGRTSNLAEVCVRMFDKLRGTAEFFQTMLKTIGVNEDDQGGELMQKIESMKLDLDKSMGEALSIVDEAKIAERNLRSLIFEQSQGGGLNTSVFSVFNETQTKNASEMVATNATAIMTSPSANMSDKQQQQSVQQSSALLSECCKKCQDLERLYESIRSTLNNELEYKEKLAHDLADQKDENSLLQREIAQLIAKVQELESRECEKCAELEKLYTSVKSNLDIEIDQKRELEAKLSELDSMNKHLEEEKEQLSSSVKENAFPRKQIVAGIRDELSKIYETMSYATDRCNSKVVSKKNRNKTSTAKHEGASSSTSSAVLQKQKQTSEQK